MNRLSISLLSIMMWLLLGGMSLHTLDPRLSVDPLPFPLHTTTPLLKAHQPQPAPDPFLTQRSSLGYELLLQRSQPYAFGGRFLWDSTRMLPERRRQSSRYSSALLLTRRQFFMPRQYFPPSADDEPFLS